MQPALPSLKESERKTNGGIEERRKTTTTDSDEARKDTDGRYLAWCANTCQVIVVPCDQQSITVMYSDQNAPPSAIKTVGIASLDGAHSRYSISSDTRLVSNTCTVRIVDNTEGSARPMTLVGQSRYLSRKGYKLKAYALYF